MNRSFEEKFWEKVDITEDDGCWEWQGCIRGADGYGVIWTKEKNILAHRAAWEIDVFPIPQGMCVLHHCDNPSCVRAEHLFIGTRADNAADRDAKGRLVVGNHRGEHAPSSKLTDEKALEIRRIHASGNYSRIGLAKKYGVAPQTIGDVVSRKTWSHI